MFNKLFTKAAAGKASKTSTKRKREVILIKKGNKTFTIAQLAEKAKVPYMTMYMRYYQGRHHTYEALMRKRSA